MGARNFRLTQDRMRDLANEESRSEIAREVEALFCDNELCDCRKHFDADEYEEALLEAVTGETAKKLAELNVTVVWAAND